MLPTLESLRSDQLSAQVAASAVLLSSLGWTLLLCLCYSVTKGNELFFSCLVFGIRLLHALIVVILGLAAINERPQPFFESGENNTGLHNLVLVISLGFFIFDSVYYPLSEKGDALLVAHHVFSVIVIGGAFYTQEGGAEMMVGMIFMEITNPLYQFRKMLRLTKYKDGAFCKIVEWAFVLLFILVRVFPCGLITLLALVDPNINLHIKLTFSLFYTLSLVMVYYTLLYVIKKYFRKGKRC